jgi:hypothetical protein
MKSTRWRTKPTCWSGVVARIDQGWPPNHESYILPARPYPIPVDLQAFDEAWSNDTFVTELYTMLGDFQDIDYCTLRALMNYTSTGNHHISGSHMKNLVFKFAFDERYIM